MRDEELAAAEAEKASQVRQQDQLLAMVKAEMDRMDPISADGTLPTPEKKRDLVLTVQNRVPCISGG